MEFKAIKELFNINDDLFGFSEIEIEKAEQRLHINFPKLLKEYYKALGNHHQLNQAQDRLLSMECVDIDDQAFLVFYAENLYTTIWGIHTKDINNSDPKVYRKVGDNAWELDAEHLSTFLNGMAFIQAAFTLEYNAGVCGLEKNYNQFINKHYKVVKEVCSLWDVTFYQNQSSELIAVFINEDMIDVFVAAKNKSDFESITGKFDFIWDYHSVRDC